MSAQAAGNWNQMSPAQSVFHRQEKNGKGNAKWIDKPERWPNSCQLNNLFMAIKMKLQYVYKFIVIIGLFIFCFIFLFERYKYYNYEIESCTSKSLIIKSQLIGGYTESLPHQKGNPYFLRIEVKNFTHEISLSEKLEFVSLSKNKSLSIESIVKSGSSKDGNGSNVFIVDSIFLPYDDYIMKGFFTSKDSTTDGFDCKIKRKYFQEFRLTFWDNLLSV